MPSAMVAVLAVAAAAAIPTGMIAHYFTANKAMVKNGGGLRAMLRSLFTAGFVKQFAGMMVRRVRHMLFEKQMKPGAVPADAVLVGLDGKTQSSLLKDFLYPLPKGTPLILSFGSSSCPPFWTSVSSVNKLFEKYCTGTNPRARALTIYIQEAHPVDAWHMPNNAGELDFGAPIRQHQSIEDRVEMAHNLIKSKGVVGDVVVDSMAGTAQKAYNAFPERLYVVEVDAKTGKPTVTFQGGIGPQFYSVSDLETYLAKRFGGKES